MRLPRLQVPTGEWEVAWEIAFDSATPTAPRLRALSILLGDPGPPRHVSDFELEVRTWSAERVDAELAALLAEHDPEREDAERHAGMRELTPGEEAEKPLDPADQVRVRCLAVLELIARGADPHASPGHRLQAASLHKRFARWPSGMSAFDELVSAMSEEEINAELELLDGGREEPGW